MATFPKKLVIRTATVRRPDLGFVFAADPKKEEQGTAHAFLYKWKAGSFNDVEIEFNVHTSCFAEKPEPALVYAAEDGNYVAETGSGVTLGDVIEDSQPRPKKPRVGGIRRLAAIDGVAHAIGIRGMAYRLESIKRWTRIDEGLPASFDGEAIDGFDGGDLYAVGGGGQVWRFHRKKWTRCQLPASANLNAVKCAGDGHVYCAGNEGVLVRGREDTWDVIEHEATDEDIWDLEWFKGELYVSTLDALYRLKKNELESVDFGKEKPRSYYQLDTANGVLWSNGELDIMAFDGKKWTRIV